MVSVSTPGLFNVDKQRTRTRHAGVHFQNWIRNNLLVGDPILSRLSDKDATGEPLSVGYMVRVNNTDANTRYLLQKKSGQVAVLNGTRHATGALPGEFVVVFSNVPERYIRETSADNRSMDVLPTSTSRRGNIPQADPGGSVSGLFQKIGESFRKDEPGLRRELRRLEARVAAVKAKIADLTGEERAEESAGFEPSVSGFDGVEGFPEDNCLFVSVLKMADEAERVGIDGDIDAAHVILGELEDTLFEVGRVRRKRRSRGRKPLNRRKSASRQRRRTAAAAMLAAAAAGKRRRRPSPQSQEGGGSEGGGGGSEGGGSSQDQGQDQGQGDYGEEPEQITEVYESETVIYGSPDDGFEDSEDYEDDYESSGISVGALLERLPPQPSRYFRAQDVWSLGPSVFAKALKNPLIRQRLID